MNINFYGLELHLVIFSVCFAFFYCKLLFYYLNGRYFQIDENIWNQRFHLFHFLHYRSTSMQLVNVQKVNSSKQQNSQMRKLYPQHFCYAEALQNRHPCSNKILRSYETRNSGKNRPIKTNETRIWLICPCKYLTIHE